MKTQRRRFNVNDVVNSTFYQVPKFLFTEEFKGLNSDARLLYGMLKNRHELSLKNKWFTEDGEVYLIYTRDEMMKMLQVSIPTAIKAMEALKQYGLLAEVRQGLRNPNLIFMCMVDELQNKEIKTVDVDGSPVDDAEKPLDSDKILEVKNLYPIYTDINQSSFSNTDNLSINQDNAKDDGLTDIYNSIETSIKQNIAYNDLIHMYPFRHDEIDALVRKLDFCI